MSQFITDPIEICVFLNVLRLGDVNDQVTLLSLEIKFYV